MENGFVRIRDEVEVMKFEDGTWILYLKGGEPFVLNSSASQALDFALQYGVQEGLEQYLIEIRKEFSNEQILQEAKEDYYYTLDICKTECFVDIENGFH